MRKWEREKEEEDEGTKRTMEEGIGRYEREKMEEEWEKVMEKGSER